MQKKIEKYFQTKLNQSVVIEALEDSGLAHWHFRIKNQRKIIRIPKQSQMGLSPKKNLEYEKACYDLCQKSGSTPELLDIIAVSSEFEMGALIIEEIIGSPMQLKEDILKVALCLAKVHQLAIDEKESVIYRPAEPIKAMLEEVQIQAEFLDKSNEGMKVKKIVYEQFNRVQKELAQIKLQDIPITPISFDCHPGNYIINENKEAILVDLEKCRYSYPGFDLAHATIYTSTTWGQRTNFDQYTLSNDEVIAFYQTWLDYLPRSLSHNSIPILLCLRKLMWLWALTWSAKWFVESQKDNEQSQGQNWSTKLSKKELIDTVAINVHDYLRVETVLSIIDTWSEQADLTYFFKNY